MMKKVGVFFVVIWKSNILKIVLILGIILLILINYWGLSLFRGQVDYQRFGTVGDWFYNFSTLIAIVVAAVTMRNDSLNAEKGRSLTLQLRNEEQDQKRREQERQMDVLSQAVYVWVGGTQDPVTKQMHDFKLGFSNKTEAPVFEWQVFDADHNVMADSLSFGPIFPGQQWISVANLNTSTALSIEFTSFLGKRYLRRDASVEEASA